MDNLTHSLVGWALGQAGFKRKTRKGLAALILGANMPDIDVFLGWAPWAPLATHRGFTHSLVGGVLLMPPLLAGLLWLLDRWQQKHGVASGSGLAMHFGWLTALSYIGTLSHPLLDWQNTYSVQLVSPFSDMWFHNDALFIIDVWIWSGLGLSIWLSRRRERCGEDWRQTAQIALALMVAYVSANGALTAFVKNDASLPQSAANPEVIFAGPAPVLFWRRDLVWREGRMVTWGRYDPWIKSRGLYESSGGVADGMTDPLARRAMTATPAIMDFMRWSVLPIARIEPGRCRSRVSFGDARYGRTVRGNRFGEDVVLATGAPGC